MDHDTARSPATIKGRQRRGFAASIALAGLLASIGLVGAACGGGSEDLGAASARSASTSTSTTTVAPSGSSGSGSSGESNQTEELQFAQCMRSRGVSGFPDPSGGGL